MKNVLNRKRSKINKVELLKFREMGDSPLITLKDIQRCLNLSYDRVHKLTQLKYFPSLRIGHAIRVIPSDFVAWVDAGRPAPEPKEGLSVRAANVVQNYTGSLYEKITPQCVRSALESGHISLECRNVGKATINELRRFASMEEI